MGSVTGTGGACVAVRETHAAVVFLVGDRAYKMKKPVDLGFLDFTAEPARRAACHREVVLNRRLAPDVYLGDVRGHRPARRAGRAARGDAPDGHPCAGQRSR